MSQSPIVTRTIGGVTRSERVIAYTFGSMWACVSCYERSGEEGFPATSSDLMSGYDYVCDVCGTRILRGNSG